MGFIVSAFMIAQGGLLKESLFKPVLLGNLGAVVGKYCQCKFNGILQQKIFCLHVEN